MLLLLIGTFMVVLDFFIVNVAIPDLQQDLRASGAEIELIVAGYAVAYDVALTSTCSASGASPWG